MPRYSCNDFTAQRFNETQPATENRDEVKNINPNPKVYYKKNIKHSDRKY